jgi:hypothetical protein
MFGAGNVECYDDFMILPSVSLCLLLIYFVLVCKFRWIQFLTVTALLLERYGTALTCSRLLITQFSNKCSDVLLFHQH